MIFLAQMAGQFMAFGTSADTKPPPTSGNGFVETDTGRMFRGNGTAWQETTASGSGGPATWGGITGTLANQSDLNTALAGKATILHNHVIADTVGLQAALDAKRPLPVYANLGTALALALATNDVVKVSPSATGTFTTTVPAAGQSKQVILLQTNTTAKTMTFGSGFKPVSTLALGTTASRVFVVSFVSDGTNLYEAGRTAAMVA